MKNTITKYLLELDGHNEVIITTKEVSKFAPINRVLDKVGYYSFDSILVNNVLYMYVFEEEERFTIKTKILISKIDREIDTLVDLTTQDNENMKQIADILMKGKKEQYIS